MGILRKSALAALAALSFGGTASGADIAGAGSTFVFPILSQWAADYAAGSGAKVSYQPIGSGGGIAGIKSATFDFGASDAPLKPEELQKFGLGQFPLVIGGIVPVVNIDGVKSGDLKFTGPLLAGIFLGKVKTWSDPAIAKLNPDLKLPDAPITVVHRSDGSGTTFNWANYFSKVSPEWRDKVGAGTGVDWPIGIGGNGSDGVAALVAQRPNSIGYIEYAYVLKNRMTYAMVQNHAGKFVTPEAASFQAAAANANWTQTRDFYLVMTDAPGEQAYPIAATSFIIMSKHPKDAARSKQALDFFRWALEKGQKQAGDLDYVALPTPLVQQIEEYWQREFGAALN
jgi:phosphate transport system substrate-binding protein